MSHAVAFRPHPGPQTEAFTWSGDVLLLGGAKKTGKSEIAIAKPTRYVHDPRFRCVVVRRSIPGLRYIESKARKLYRQICPTVDHNLTQHLFTFPNLQRPREPGAQILFTYAETLSDCERLEGWGYQALIIDEARQFPDPMLIDTLSAELYAEIDPATGKPWMRTWTLLTSNPGGRGGEWLRERFAIDKFPKGGADIYDPNSGLYRRYIHMTIRDNPSMDAAKYLAQLRQFPAWKQKQMIDGDWFQKEGSAYEEFDPQVHVVDKFDPRGCEIHRSCDWGFSTVCAVHYWAVNPDHYGTVCIGELTFSRTKPRDVARACLRFEEQHGYEVVSAVIGKDAKRVDITETSPKRAMAELGVNWREARDGRNEGYQAICSRLSTNIELWDGTSIPSLRFVRDACPKLIQTLPILPQHPFEDDIWKEQCKQANGSKGNDHWADSLRYHVMSLPLPEKAPEQMERLGGSPRMRRERPQIRNDHEQRGF